MPKNLKPWKTISSKSLLDTRFLKVNQEVCELPNGKVIPDFYTLWQPDWVLILAQTKNGEWIMERQYRHGTGKIALEFPAGIVDAGESPLEAAKRELQEECAYAGGKFEYLAELPMNPDRHRGRFFVVRATGVEPQGNTHFDMSEEIETLLLSTETVIEKMRSGEIHHPHQIAAFMLYGVDLQQGTLHK